MSNFTVGATVVTVDGSALSWTAGLAVDADGCPTAYGPPGTQPRDALGNAGHPNNWWGVVTDNGESSGNPIVQGPTDPAPGYYVSATSLCDGTRKASDPLRYVDSARVPYLAIPRDLLQHGAHVGDVAIVRYKGLSVPAIVADVGPKGKIGEGSIALAAALGLDPSPRHGGIGGGVSVTLWTGTHRGWPRTAEDIAAQVSGLVSGTASL